MKLVSIKFLLLFLSVFGTSYLINLFWEVAHSVLYDWARPPLQNSVYYYVPKILGATLGDAVIISLIFLAASAVHRNSEWIKKPHFKDFFFIAALGFFAAVMIEVRAMIQTRWSYSQYMPLVFGLGLSPLMQLSITGILTLLVARIFYASIRSL